MENVLQKTRIAMLWVFMAFILLGLPRRSIDDQIAVGGLPVQPTPEYLLLSTVASLIFFAMPFLCLTLKDSSNRIVNIILGIAFTLVGIAGTASSLAQLTASNAYLTLMYAAASVAPAVIVYYAYRWPKE